MMIVFASFAKSSVDTDRGDEYLKHCLSGLEIYAKAKTVPNERDTPLFLSSLALSNYLPHNYIVHSIGSILSNLDLSAGDKLLSDCRIALAIVETFYSKSNENKHNSTYLEFPFNVVVKLWVELSKIKYREPANGIISKLEAFMESTLIEGDTLASSQLLSAIRQVDMTEAIKAAIDQRKSSS
jgi:hypothetical protein